MKRNLAFVVGVAIGIAILFAYHATSESLAMKSCLEKHSQDVCVTTLAGG